MVIVLEGKAKETVNSLDKKKEFMSVLKSHLKEKDIETHREVVVVCEFYGHKFLVEGREHLGQIRIKHIDILEMISFN